MEASTRNIAIAVIGVAVVGFAPGTLLSPDSFTPTALSVSWDVEIKRDMFPTVKNWYS